MDAPKKYDQVFLTTGLGGSVVDGQRPIKGSVWGLVSRSLRKIGITKACRIPRGPHSIRHAFASKLLAENTPMKDIADLLGHKSIRTAYVYTKSDVNRLRMISEEWPEVAA